MICFDYIITTLVYQDVQLIHQEYRPMENLVALMDDQRNMFSFYVTAGEYMIDYAM